MFAKTKMILISALILLILAGMMMMSGCGGGGDSGDITATYGADQWHAQMTAVAP